MTRYKLADLNWRFLDFCIRKRLGKTFLSTVLIYATLYILGLFEKYKNTEDFKKRGHYIPKLILKKFSISEKGPNKGMVYQYNFLTDRITPEPINNIAQIEDFYIYKQKGGGYSDYVEKIFFGRIIEGIGSRVIDVIDRNNDDPELTIIEENMLATFVSHQLTRTPAFLADLRKFILYLYEKKLLKMDDLNNPRFIHEVIILNKHGVTYEDMINFKPIFSLSGDLNLLSSIARNIGVYLQKKIFSHKFNFLHVPYGSDDNFVISDSPVVLVDFTRFEVKRYLEWWNIYRDDVWIFIPLSKKKCLQLTTQSRIGGKVERNFEPLVSLVNFGQFLNSLAFVFSNDNGLLQKYLSLFTPELLKYKTRIEDPEQIFKA